MPISNNDRCAYVLIAVIASAYLLMAIQFPMAYLWATYEDLAGEWLQFWLFVFAMYYFLRLALIKSRFRLFFSVMALSCFYVAMEEISWGQRLLDLPTPEFFRMHNIQKETNLHNLFTGPLATTTKRLIEYGLVAGMLGYGVLYPLSLRWRLSASKFFVRMGIAPPPLFLWPFFALSAFCELGILKFNEAEIAEILMAFALTIIAFYYYSSYRSDRQRKYTTDIESVSQTPVASAMVVLLVSAGLLAAGTTAYSYTSASNRQRIETRMLNGVEKFAGRYKRYEQWETAASLYLRVHDKEPNRNSILRKLAECYHQIGDEQRFQRYNDLALQNDLKRLSNNPDSIAIQQSLARTYRQQNDFKQADSHLETALHIALTRVADNPESASAAYWLGRTYKLMGRYKEALNQFKAACKLSPSNIKYQKAYYRLKNSASVEKS